MLFKTLAANQNFVIPFGLNAGKLVGVTGTVTLTPYKASVGAEAAGTLNVAADYTFPDGVDLGGSVISTATASGVSLELFRVGGKPESDEGRKK